MPKKSTEEQRFLKYDSHLLRKKWAYWCNMLIFYAKYSFFSIVQ